MPRFGKRSKKRLEGVDIKLQHILNKLIQIMDVTIIEGLRSQKRQDELVKKGASKTKYSKHIRERFHYMGGMVRGIAHELDIKIRWGGDWDGDGEIKDNSFDDLVHIEIK